MKNNKLYLTHTCIHGCRVSRYSHAVGSHHGLFIIDGYAVNGALMDTLKGEKI